jgi:hypothetical protein
MVSGRLQNLIPKTKTDFEVQKLAKFGRKLAKLVLGFGNQVSEPYQN